MLEYTQLMQKPVDNLSLDSINTNLETKRRKHIFFLVFLVLFIVLGIVLYISQQNKYILLVLVVIALFVGTTSSKLYKINKLKQNLKENPEHYKNAQGHYSLSDIDLLLGSWLWF